MRNEDDVEFYLYRTRAAIAMSEAAADPSIRGIHLVMAQRYADLAADPALRMRVRGSVPDGQPSTL